MYTCAVDVSQSMGTAAVCYCLFKFMAIGWVSYICMLECMCVRAETDIRNIRISV